MRIHDSVAFITGANRGLGLAFAEELLAAGARKVYAAARDPWGITLDRVDRVHLDVTKPETVGDAARRYTDVNLLINNTETNYFGPLLLSRAFAPVLAKNGGGAIVNVLSVLSWISVPEGGGYSASKSAGWSLTNWLRTALHEQGTQVVGLHAGPIETDMAQHLTLPQVTPVDVVRQTLSAIETGRDEVLVDQMTRQVKTGLSIEEGVYLNFDPKRVIPGLE